MQRSLKDYCSSFLKEGLFSAEHVPPPLFLALYSSIYTFLFCLSLLHTESHWAATSLVHCGQADDCLPLLPAQLAASSTAPRWQFPLHTGRHSRIPVTQGTRLWFAAGHVLWQLLCGSALGKEGVLQLTLRFCS